MPDLLDTLVGNPYVSVHLLAEQPPSLNTTTWVGALPSLGSVVLAKCVLKIDRRPTAALFEIEAYFPAIPQEQKFWGFGVSTYGVGRFLGLIELPTGEVVNGSSGSLKFQVQVLVESFQGA